MPSSNPSHSFFLSEATDQSTNTSSTSNSQFQHDTSSLPKGPRNATRPDRVGNLDNDNQLDGPSELDDFKYIDLEGKTPHVHGPKTMTFSLLSEAANYQEEPASPVAPLQLPSEILIDIFSWLDLSSLKVAATVCTNWQHIVNDDSLWRKIFCMSFGNESFFSRLTSSVSWRVEYAERVNALRRWKRDSLNTRGIITFKIPIYFISSYAVDFVGMRVITYSLIRNQGFAADLTKGRLGYPCIKPQIVDEYTSVVSSKFGMAFGYADGTISTITFSRRTSVRDYKNFMGAHHNPVMALWTCQNVSPRTDKVVSLVSGDDMGMVKGWSFTTAELLFEFALPSYKVPANNGFGLEPNSDAPAMVHVIECDAENTVVVLDLFGRIFRYNVEKKELKFIAQIDPIGPILYSPKKFTVDFVAGYLLALQNDHILRIKIDVGAESIDTNDQQEGEMVKFVTEEQRAINGFALDESNFTGVTTSSTPKLLPGQGGRLIVAFTATNNVYLWNMRERPVTQPYGTALVIRPLWKVDKPFGSVCDIEAIAVNSLVFAVCSTWGRVLIYNILTAKMVRQANKRISRKVWDFSSFSMHSFNVELNPDATKCNGVVVIDDIVQYFSYGGGLEGSVNGSTTTTAGKKSKNKGIKKRVLGGHLQRNSNDTNATNNVEILKEMEDDYEVAQELIRKRKEDDAEARRYGEMTRDTAFLDEMSEEEMIRYAMLISNDSANNVQQEAAGSLHDTNDSLNGIDQEDEDLNAAIQLSLLETPAANSESVPDEYFDEQDNGTQSWYCDEPSNDKSRKSSSSSLESWIQGSGDNEYAVAGPSSAATDMRYDGFSKPVDQEDASWLVAARKTPKTKGKKGSFKGEDEMDEDLALAIKLSMEQQ